MKILKVILKAIKEIPCRFNLHLYREKELIKTFGGIPMGRVKKKVCIFCDKVFGENIKVG